MALPRAALRCRLVEIDGSCPFNHDWVQTDGEQRAYHHEAMARCNQFLMDPDDFAARCAITAGAEHSHSDFTARELVQAGLASELIPTIRELAEDALESQAGLSKTFDYAIPVGWMDEVRKAIGEWPTGFVWHYPEGSIFGAPFPLTSTARRQLAAYEDFRKMRY